MPGAGLSHSGLSGSGLSDAGSCCAGAEVAHVLGRAALPGMGAGQGAEAEVAADRSDDLGNQQGVEVVVEVGVVQALAKLGVEGVRLGAVGLALDGVLDRADDLLARKSACPS